MESFESSSSSSAIIEEIFRAFNRYLNPLKSIPLCIFESQPTFHNRSSLSLSISSISTKNFPLLFFASSVWCSPDGKHRYRTSVSSLQTEGKPIAEIKFKTRKNCRATLISTSSRSSFWSSWEAAIFFRDRRLKTFDLLSRTSKANSINGRQIEPYWITPVHRVVFVIVIPNWTYIYIYTVFNARVRIPSIGNNDSDDRFIR